MQGKDRVDKEKKTPTSYPWTEEDIKFYYDKVLDMTSKYSYIRSEEFVELLIESCLAEKALNEGLVYFLTKIKELGLEIETDQEKMTKDIDKLSRLRFYRKMIYALGLEKWEDELMKVEIAKTLNPVNPPQTLSPAGNKNAK